MNKIIDDLAMDEYHATSARSAHNLIDCYDSCELSAYEKDNGVETVLVFRGVEFLKSWRVYLLYTRFSVDV